MTMKRILFAAALFAALDAAAQLPAEIRIDKRSLRPRYREWAQPAGGTAVTQNPPALLWPAAGDSKRAVYRVRLSQDLCRSYALGAFRMGGLCLPRAAGRRALVLAVVRHGTRRCGALVGGQCLHGRCFVQAVRHSDG